MNDLKQAALQYFYLHFPFCETKCHYCDFYSLAAKKTTPEQITQFGSALRREIELTQQWGLLDQKIETIFMGGGTPSMTDPELMAHALEPLELSKRLAPSYEWSVECNPSSLSKEKIQSLHLLGVNRISMGVQSLSDERLKWLGRVHDRKQVFLALDWIFNSPIQKVSVDLICGIPGQTLNDLENEIRELTQFPITHLSCYLLTLPKHHPLAKQLPDENSQLEHLLFIDQTLGQFGFEHYEISNFAKKGNRAKHNLAYWEGKGYLGLGPSAHSYFPSKKMRIKNFSSLQKWSQALLEKNTFGIEWKEVLTPDQENLEKWMLALRLSDGFPKDWLSTHQKLRISGRLMEEGIMENHPTRPNTLRLTAKGFALSDTIIKELA